MIALVIIEILELPIALNKAAPELYKAINGYDSAETRKKVSALFITPLSTLPKAKCNIEVLNNNITPIMIKDKIAVINNNCLAEKRAFSSEPCPINCAATTAPPVPKAAKTLINKTLIESTSETAETAASPTLETMIVSQKPTRITNNCSITSGMISFFNA